jgi:hypothetical protein
VVNKIAVLLGQCISIRDEIELLLAVFMLHSIDIYC